MAYLYLELLKDSLNEYAYAAELAGLNYDLQNTIYGMYVSIHNPFPSPTSCRLPFIILRPGYSGSGGPWSIADVNLPIWPRLWPDCKLQ